jgi:hypothetical protein
LVQWLCGFSGILAFRPSSEPFKVLAIVVLGFRIALRNGSQWEPDHAAESGRR